ncbi:ATP synthase gamma chain OS=Stutzerimonas stutzeri OX=316 GN=atpG PE=3 SV=1 [Stutzerimonas stutzeri]
MVCGGGLNINLFKALIKSMKEWHDQRVEVDLCVIGNKGASFFRSFGGNVVAAIGNLGEAPSINDLIGSVKVMLDGFNEGRIDRLYLASNKFINTMTQKPMVDQLLPLAADASAEPVKKGQWDYLYEPDAQQLLDALLVRFIESQVYQAVVENGAAEQAARMIAMKNATDNAGELIGDLQLVYNKARQAAITQEISEIVGGAAAV